jgi:hypothetical protein
VCPTAARWAFRLARACRCDLSTRRYDVNSLRWFGPQRASVGFRLTNCHLSMRVRQTLREALLQRPAPAAVRPLPVPFFSRVAPPTDPYVLALEHTVPQPADSPPGRDPEAIRARDVDRAWNLDGFRMFPGIESTG